MTLKSASSNNEGIHSIGQMAAVGAGVGSPLLLALLGDIVVILRQRNQLRPSSSTSAVKLHEKSDLSRAQSQSKSTSTETLHDIGQGSKAQGRLAASAHYSTQQGHFRELDASGKPLELDVEPFLRELSPKQGAGELKR